jgi:Domain of unknown function (DUF4349)
MSQHASHHRLLPAATTLLLAFAIAGCGAAQEAGQPLDGDAAAPRQQDQSDGGGGDDRAALRANAAPIEQRIVKTGEVGLEVDNVAVALAEVRAMAVELGGHVGASQAGTLDESASVTLRVPAERFDELLTRLQELAGAEVISMSTREEDVTGRIVDLDARIRNLRASEVSYRVLFDRAERIDDILRVQQRLDDVRGQIEQLEAQLQAIEEQADLSTLTVTIIPRGEPVAAVQADWDPGAQAKNATAALIGLAQGVLDALIWIVIVIVPIALVVGLIAIGALRLVPGVRRRLVPAEVDASGDRPPTG